MQQLWMETLQKGETLSELLGRAARNSVRFTWLIPTDSLHERHQKTYRDEFIQWLTTQSATIQKIARKYPVSRLYRLRGGLVGRAGEYPYGIITCYVDSPGGVTCGLIILGKSGLEEGTVSAPLLVPPDALEDVTLLAQQGALPEQHKII